MTQDQEKIEVENVNIPGHTERVNKAKYSAMRKALIKTLPKKQPGITAKAAKEKVLPLLPEELYPEGKTAGWWLKTVQLDLEAKGIVKRTNTKPLTFYRV